MLILISVLFSKKQFDICIVDEASQLTLPACLGPLRFANTFVLVGDHYQLTPLVRSEKAKQGGLDVSLFKLLSEAHPSSVSKLRTQYRMNQDIQSLSNTLIYNQQLKCGSNEIAHSSLELPKLEFFLKKRIPSPSRTCLPNGVDVLEYVLSPRYVYIKTFYKNFLKKLFLETKFCF
jgi:DNA replication ATP-dependent helicase Dna2